MKIKSMLSNLPAYYHNTLRIKEYSHNFYVDAAVTADFGHLETWSNPFICLQFSDEIDTCEWRVDAESWSLVKQLVQTLTGSYSCSLGSGIAFSEQS